VASPRAEGGGGGVNVPRRLPYWGFEHAEPKVGGFLYAPRIPADLLIRSGYTCSSTNLSRRNIVALT